MHRGGSNVMSLVVFVYVPTLRHSFIFVFDFSSHAHLVLCIQYC